MELIAMSAGDMARQIAEGRITSSELVVAHIARIKAVNPQLNAVVVQRFDQARTEAAAVDQAHKRGEPLGPLGGVPITVKECFHLTGTCATEGVGRFAQEMHSSDNP